MTGPASYVRGEVVPGWHGPRPEATQFQIDSDGLTLLHHYRRPTPREIRGARTGKARFGLVPAGRHTMFLLYDIEHLTKGWSDAPYAFGLVAVDRRELQPREPHQGRLLMSILVDADTGTLHAIRGVSLTPAFSDALDRLLDAQRAALPDFTPAAHDAELRAAYARWPDPAAMAGAAVAIEQGGMPFPAP